MSAFIQLGEHMVDTVPEGIRVKIRGWGGGVTMLCTLLPSSLSTGAHSSSNSSSSTIHGAAGAGRARRSPDDSDEARTNPDKPRPSRTSPQLEGALQGTWCP